MRDLRNVSEIKYTRYSATSNETLTDTIKAKIFVIAANAIETPRLLLMSKNDGRTPDGVANSSGMVGKYLMDHPYYVAWGQLPMDGEAAALALPRSAHHVGHRRLVRRTIPQPARRIPCRHRQRGLELRWRRASWAPIRTPRPSISSMASTAAVSKATRPQPAWACSVRR